MWILSRIFGESKWTRLTFITVAAQLALVIIFEAVIYAYHSREVDLLISAQFDKLSDTTVAYANARSLSVYHALFMVAQIFACGFVVDAIYQQNTIELGCLAFFEMGLFIYSVIQYHQAATLFNDYPQILATLGDQFHLSAWAEETVIGLSALYMLAYCWFAFKLYQEFGWTIYKKIGADLAMREMYKTYQIFMTILKFDLFFFIGFSVQYLAVLVVTDTSEAGMSSNSAGQSWTPTLLATSLAEHIVLSVLATVVLFIFAFWGLMSEKKPAFITFMVIGVGSLGYFIYSLWDISAHPSLYVGSRIFLTFFLTVCLVMIITTLIIAWHCLGNFNKGLKYHIRGARKSPQNSFHSMQAFGIIEKDGSKRWSIE